MSSNTDPQHLRGQGNEQSPAAASSPRRAFHDGGIAKGFVRPFRTDYVHQKCNTRTRMRIQIAEAFARDPVTYAMTYCVQCEGHFPVAEFKWIDGAVVGS